MLVVPEPLSLAELVLVGDFRNCGAFGGIRFGVMNMGNQIGGAVTASLTPLIAKHFGWGTSFVVAAALCAVGSLTWLLVDPQKELSLNSAEATAMSQV